jgi:formylglycine-generating enzyme required for sulfatase activity
MMTHVPTSSRRSGSGLIVLGVMLVVLLVGALLVWRFALSDVLSKRGEPSAPTGTEPAPETAASPTNPPTATANGAPEGMVYVEGGMYYVGRDDGDPYARPRRTVTLAPFYIDRTETTNAEYQRFVDERLHPAPEGWIDGHHPPGTENLPVVNVSWEDSAAFARWAGKRLPTETEWEVAARGKDERIFPWGNAWRESAANIGTQGVVEVGRFKAGASACGAFDLLGNVWEWTSDEFHLYPGNKESMPLLKAGVTYRVFRGGAYDAQARSLDASYRGFLDGGRGYPKVGFRCVKNADQ